MVGPTKQDLEEENVELRERLDNIEAALYDGDDDGEEDDNDAED